MIRLRLLGAGGHAKIAADAWVSSGGEVAAIHDDDSALEGALVGQWRVLRGIAAAFDSEDRLHIAIGNNEIRRRIAASADDARFPSVIHAGATTGPGVTVGAGSLICAGAIVQPDAAVGRHVIVNTAALVEHDCRIADFVHIAPGVRLAGEVSVGEGALIGIGAVAIPGIRIGAGAVVGAGSVVIRDVPAGAVVAGNPAAPIR